MATAVLPNASVQFPNGTSVAVYNYTDFPAWWTGGALPAGISSVTSASVATDGSLTFTGLTQGNKYRAYASVNAVPTYTVFSVSDVSGSSANPESVTGTALTTATEANVASSASSVTLFAANTAAKARTIVNDSTAVLYVKFGSTASATSYTVALVAGAYYEFPQPFYNGRVDGIWTAANGNARTTELAV